MSTTPPPDRAVAPGDRLRQRLAGGGAELMPGVWESLATLRREGTLRDGLDRLVAFDDFTELVGLDRYLALESEVSVSDSAWPEGVA